MCKILKKETAQYYYFTQMILKNRHQAFVTKRRLSSN